MTPPGRKVPTPAPAPSLPKGREERGGGPSPCLLPHGPHRSPSAGLPVPH